MKKIYQEQYSIHEVLIFYLIKDDDHEIDIDENQSEMTNYLITTEITDMKDLKGVDESKCWTKAAYRPIFKNSARDLKFIQLEKIILNFAKELSLIRNVKKQKISKLN